MLILSTYVSNTCAPLKVVAYPLSEHAYCKHHRFAWRFYCGSAGTLYVKYNAADSVPKTMNRTKSDESVLRYSLPS